MEWSGERGEESSSTGTCPCGWTESASSQKVVRSEYRAHLRQKIKEQHLLEARLRNLDTEDDGYDDYLVSIGAVR
jgi:hypothetical protein